MIYSRTKQYWQLVPPNTSANVPPKKSAVLYIFEEISFSIQQTKGEILNKHYNGVAVWRRSKEALNVGSLDCVQNFSPLSDVGCSLHTF